MEKWIAVFLLALVGCASSSYHRAPAQVDNAHVEQMSLKSAFDASQLTVRDKILPSEFDPIRETRVICLNTDGTYSPTAIGNLYHKKKTYFRLYNVNVNCHVSPENEKVMAEGSAE